MNSSSGINYPGKYIFGARDVFVRIKLYENVRVLYENLVVFCVWGRAVSDTECNENYVSKHSPKHSSMKINAVQIIGQLKRTV